MDVNINFIYSMFRPTRLPGVDLLVNCRGARYQNIWFEKYLKDWQKQNNIELFMHEEAIRHQVLKDMYKLTDAIIQ